MCRQEECLVGDADFQCVCTYVIEREKESLCGFVIEFVRVYVHN